MDRARAHWDGVWGERRADEVSWFQSEPTISLALIERIAPPTASVVDVGGGASVLVDRLLDRGFGDVTVIDIAGSSLAAPRRRLGSRRDEVRWLVGDVTTVVLDRTYDVWHDRALLHFLQDADAVARYRRQMRSAVRVGGHAVIATFGPEGPETCSGLAVHRYGFSELDSTVGAGFETLDHVEERHHTPAGVIQQFVYGLYRRTSGPG